MILPAMMRAHKAAMPPEDIGFSMWMLLYFFYEVIDMLLERVPGRF